VYERETLENASAKIETFDAGEVLEAAQIGRCFDDQRPADRRAVLRRGSARRWPSEYQAR
jgi:hypothetical protein